MAAGASKSRLSPLPFAAWWPLLPTPLSALGRSAATEADDEAVSWRCAAAGNDGPMYSTAGMTSAGGSGGLLSVAGTADGRADTDRLLSGLPRRVTPADRRRLSTTTTSPTPMMARTPNSH